LKELTERIIDGLKRVPDANRFVVGIVGYPGAGKSTLAGGLVDALNACLPVNQRAQILPMDGYHLPNERLDLLGLRELKGIPDTFDALGFIALLRQVKLVSDHPIYAPAFDRSIDGAVENAIQIRPDVKVIVAEGNYLLLETGDWGRIAELLDDSWFLEASLETIRPRLIERHVRAGRTKDEAIAKIESTDLPNALLIGESQKRARALIQAVDNRSKSIPGLIYKIANHSG